MIEVLLWIAFISVIWIFGGIIFTLSPFATKLEGNPITEAIGLVIILPAFFFTKFVSKKVIKARQRKIDRESR